MKTSYLIIGGLAIAAGAYWYTHRASTPAKPTPASSASSAAQSTTSKVLTALGSSLQAFSGVFSKSSATTSKVASDDDAVARANVGGLDIDNAIQL